jgi:Tripartite tricarboxylate transporter TctB family
VRLGTRIHINKDLVAGLMFMVWGAAALWLSRNYPIGSAVRMGPGYFPVVLSWLLIGFGVVIAARGVLTHGEPLARWYWRPLVMVLLSFLVFAALIDRAGLAIAGILSILVGAYGGADFRLREAIVLAVGLTIGAVALFVYALSLPMRILPF